MPPSRTQRPAAQWDASASTILPRPRARPPQNAGNVSLSSTVGAPTPARPSSRNMADYSLASTIAASTPAAQRRSRPVHPAMHALTSADTSLASTSYGAPPARGPGRPPRSILATPTSLYNNSRPTASRSRINHDVEVVRRSQPIATLPPRLQRPKSAADRPNPVMPTQSPPRQHHPRDAVDRLVVATSRDSKLSVCHRAGPRDRNQSKIRAPRCH